MDQARVVEPHIVNHANLIAYLTGLIAAERQLQGMAVDAAGALAHELWTAAADDASGPARAERPDAPVAHRVARLAKHVARRVSESAASLAERYLHVDHPADEARTAQVRLAPLFPGQAGIYREALTTVAAGVHALEDKPEETPEATLCALWHSAAGTPMSAVRALELPLPALDEATAQKLQRLIEERLSGIPLAHITGCQHFMGIEMRTSPDALIPRRETELLGFSALGILHRLAIGTENPRVIDVCTGSGNLALSLATHEPGARVFASDLSPDAVALARRNSISLGLDDRVEFRQGDFLVPFEGGDFDHGAALLVCNPPYISSAKVGTMSREITGHEPQLAFDGGPFGVRILLRLISEAPRYLRHGGWLAFEVGSGQGPTVLERLRRNTSYTGIVPVTDAGGTVRAVLACT